MGRRHVHCRGRRIARLHTRLYGARMKRDPKDMPDWQFIVRLGCNFITATLLAAIVMGGFVLLCEKTEPTSVAPAQSDTVFDRGARYD